MTGPTSQILFADDDEGIRTMVGEVLRSAGFGVRLAESGAQALAEVRQSPPDLVMLDYRMGAPDGFEVCRRIKSDPRLAHLPVLILTGQGGVEDRLAGFGAGADDYLPKPFDPRELVARATALLRQARRGRDRNPTTGLPGGLALYDEIERRRAMGKPFAVSYFDLDHFKPFSDRFGFAVADAAIRETGAAVQTAAEGDPGAFVGHVGGDDFVMVGDPRRAREIAAAARALFAARLPRHLPPDDAARGSYRGRDRDGAEREFPVTRLSAAIVVVDPARWTSLEEMGEVVAMTKSRAKHENGPGIAEAEM